MTDLQYSACRCYKCTEPEYAYTESGHRYLYNNMERHTLGEPCSECDRPKSEYHDLGTKGRYICWYCRGDGNGDAIREHNPPDLPDIDP